MAAEKFKLEKLQREQAMKEKLEEDLRKEEVGQG